MENAILFSGGRLTLISNVLDNILPFIVSGLRPEATKQAKKFSKGK